MSFLGMSVIASPTSLLAIPASHDQGITYAESTSLRQGTEGKTRVNNLMQEKRMDICYVRLGKDDIPYTGRTGTLLPGFGYEILAAVPSSQRCSKSL